MALWLIFILLVVLFVPTGLLAILGTGPITLLTELAQADYAIWIFLVGIISMITLLDIWGRKDKERIKEAQEKKEFMRRERNRRKWLKELDEMENKK